MYYVSYFGAICCQNLIFKTNTQKSLRCDQATHCLSTVDIYNSLALPSGQPVLLMHPPPHTYANGWLLRPPISFYKGGNGANSRFNRHIESRLTSSRAMWSQISEQLPVFRVLIPIKATHPMVHCTAGCCCKGVSLHMKRGFE